MSEVETYSALVGQIAKSVSTERVTMTFVLMNGKTYQFYHEQDCCENVYIESVDGDLRHLEGSELLTAESVSSPAPTEFDYATWTFYKFATAKGSVTVRWIGESNGYYSERVDFAEVK